MNLYNLPKDMLVSLVSEIAEDVKKKYESQIKRLELKLEMADKLGIYYINCDYENCEKITAYIDGDSLNYFSRCKKCEKKFCDNHNIICEMCEKIYCNTCYNEHLLPNCEECKGVVCERSTHNLQCEFCDKYYCALKTSSILCSEECKILYDAEVKNKL